MYSVCIVIELHVTVNYIKKTERRTAMLLWKIYFHRQQCKLYVQVFETNYIPNNCNFFALHI